MQHHWLAIYGIAYAFRAYLHIFRFPACVFLHTVSHNRHIGCYHKLICPWIIDINNRCFLQTGLFPVCTQHTEQNGFCFAVVFHCNVIIQMILCQVGKYRYIKITAGYTLQFQCMRAYLHNSVANPFFHHLRKQLL